MHVNMTRNISSTLGMQIFKPKGQQNEDVVIDLYDILNIPGSKFKKLGSLHHLKHLVGSDI